MSLINKLLQDLEKRDAHFEEFPDTVLDGLYSAYDVEQSPARHRSSIIIVTASMLLVSAVIAVLALKPVSVAHWPAGQDETGEDNRLVKPAIQEQALPENETVASETIGPEAGRADENVAAEDMVMDSSNNMSLRLDQGLTVQQSAQIFPERDPAVLSEPSSSASAVLLEHDPDGLLLRFELSEKVPYQVYTLESPYRTVFELNDTRLRDDLPDISGIENIVAVRKHRDQNDQSRFVIESSTPYIIDQTNIRQDGNHYVLRVRLLSADAESPADMTYFPAPGERKPQADSRNNNPPVQPKTVVKGDIVKSARKPVTISKTDKLLYQGERLYRQGKIAEALDRLYAAVESDPRHRVARTTLALRLSDQQQFDLADKTLRQGLAIVPGMPDWALALAQIHMRTGRLAEAEDVLTGAIPPVTENPDYHALYAAVLQKREKHRMAAEVYRNLLQINPDNGIWWMGLAISLEAISMSSDARFAYRNALAVKSLTPETQQYIIERIRILEQQLANETS